MDAPIVSAREVHKKFQLGNVEVHALRGIDLDVMPGEMVAVMGPSGCGKTTMLNCLSGLDEFDSGEVRVEGTNLRDMSDRQRTSYRAHRMGFVFQTFNLLPVINAVENVELPLLVGGMRTSDALATGHGGVAAGGPRRSAEPPAGRAFRWATPAGHHRPRAGERSRPCVGGRADGQSGQHLGGRGANADAQAQSRKWTDVRTRDA